MSHFSPLSRIAATGILAATLLHTASTPAAESAAPLSPAVQARLLRAGQGQIVDMGAPLSDKLPDNTYFRVGSGPQFAFSDDPEYFRVPEGAAMRETVKPGVVRIYVYEVNGTTDTVSKITTVIENLGSAPLKHRFLRYGSSGPDKDYWGVAKAGMVGYFGSEPGKWAPEIPVGGAAVLDPKMDRGRVKFDELVHGFYEIEVTQPARLTVLQTAPDTPSIEANARIKTVLPPHNLDSGAGRGLYQISDFDIALTTGTAIDTAKGMTQLIVADGKRDSWITGHDSSRDGGCILKGNYGVIYRMKLDWKSADGRDLAVMIWNPHGDSCWGMAAAVKVNAGVFPGGLVEIPSDKPVVVKKTDAVLIQRYPAPPKGTTGTIELTYTPPGAACLPTPILFVPIDKQ